MTGSTIDRIIDIAEAQVRAGGYNSFSFRAISKEVGIKSASIHYHFPTKTDLGVAVASRYTERFSQKLQSILDSDADVKVRLSHYIALFRYALEVDKKMCLCGQLATEVDVLPEAIQQETARFFVLNLSWLGAHVFNGLGDRAKDRAALLLASLEGALMLSKVLNSGAHFDQISEELLTLLS